MNTKWKIITSVMLVIFAFCACFTVLFILQSRDNLEEFTTLYAEGVQGVVSTVQEQTSRQYQKRIKSFLRYNVGIDRENMIQAFAEQDRETLLRLTMPYFELFKKEDPYFTTLTWLLPDNMSYLHMHDIGKPGKNVSKVRPDIVRANVEHRQYAGYAVSSAGMQYRIVNPVTYNEQHVGILHFGLDVCQLLDAIHGKLQLPVGLVLPTNEYDRIKQKKKPALAGDSFAIFASQVELFKDDFHTIDWSLKKQRVVLFDRDYIILKAVSLDNYAGESQGHIFVALDISKKVASARSRILFMVLLSAMLLALSFLILHFGYNALAQKILDLQVVEKVNSKLEKMVIRRTAELEENRKALEAEKEWLSVTLRSIGDAVITTDIEGKVIFLNKVAEKLTGWASEEAAGKTSTEIFNIINEKTGEKCASPIQRVLELGRIIGLANHTALIARDGAVRSIADSGAPIRDRQSNIIGVVLVFRDITREKKIEEELLKIRKLESVGVLAGGIAHDFNNLLTAILGNVELAGFRLGKEDSSIAPLLADAGEATKRATKLTRQLLTFSKGGDPVKEETSLANLISESSEFVLRGSKVRCKYSCFDHLWLVDVDSGQISQVIQNIIINAKQAMPEGGTVTIECANVHDAAAEALLSVDKGDYVRITLQDTGVGIPKEIIDKVFDPYFTTKQEGSGLGLAICHSIINKHDGHLLVDSTPGKGTIFTVYLPALQSTNNSVVEKNTETVAPVKAARVMVMDDEAMVRDVAKEQLLTLGHEPITVNDGTQAINCYQEMQDLGTPVDLVIMDLTIPGGMGGQEAAEKLLLIDPQARIIVASGYSNDPIMADYKKYGFCGAVAKPFDLKGLSKAIASAFLG